MACHPDGNGIIRDFDLEQFELRPKSSVIGGEVIDSGHNFGWFWV
jgi:hypothetical protein